MIKSYHIIRMLSVFSLSLFVLLSFTTLIPIYNNIDNVEATAGTATASTLTFTSTRSTASVNLTVDDKDGTFATSTDGTGNTSDQRAIFSIATNNYTGYTLRLKSSTSNTNLSNTTNNTSIPSLVDSTTYSTFSSDTSEGRALNNRWGYIPNYYNATGTSPVQNTTTYYPAPTTSGTTLRTTTSRNSANGEDNPDNYTIGLGFRADFTNPTGSYTNDAFILEFVANPVVYSITFADNTNDASVANLPSSMTSGASGTTDTSVTLPNTVPTRTGYTFNKWCLGTVSNNGTTCGGTPGTQFSAGDSFGIDQTAASNIVTLYATWTPNTYNLVITGDANVASLTVKKGSTSGISTSCTKSNTTFTCASLEYGTSYYLYPVFNSGYEFNSWAKTDSATGASLGSTSAVNTYYTMGNGAGAVTLTSKSSCTPTNSLYCKIAAMSKGTQTDADIQAAIVAPTSSAPTSSNSGVYEYNASVFGTASDAASTNKIYYYRGILDSYGNTGSYGSDGKADAYPNYVILDANGTKDTSDTCWRIVRTTGSGGVKMIYNGKWTGSTCANAQAAAQLTTKAFNGTSSTYQQIVRVGYTYNSTYATNTAQSGTIAQIFGTNSTPTVNNTRSDIKTYIEDTWYASNMTSWTSKLEASAGYCNDRTMYTSTSWTSPLAESSNIAATYGTSGLQDYHFGAYPRNANAAQKPSLTCAKYSNVDRSTVDLYRYVANSAGVSNQLKYPAALLTADEVSFAGSGRSTASQGSSYHVNSYLHSGSVFWLLSPVDRSSNGNANGFILPSNGSLSSSRVGGAYGVRPAISLVSGTTISGGSGIATDPWVILPPPKIQDTAVANLSEGEEKTVIDARDGNDYTIKKINGALWMTQNLRFTGTSVSSTTSNVTSDKALTYYQLDTDGDASGEKCNGSNGYSNACIKDSGSTSTGVWYNYYAATAGTISGSSSSTAASQDICPKNWHLPTGPNTTANTDINILVGNTTSGWQDPTAGLTAFGAVSGGYYVNGSLSLTGNGYWWSATAYVSTHRYYMSYDSGNGQFNGGSNFSRYVGRFVRCVRST